MMEVDEVLDDISRPLVVCGEDDGDGRSLYRIGWHRQRMQEKEPSIART